MSYICFLNLISLVTLRVVVRGSNILEQTRLPTVRPGQTSYAGLCPTPTASGSELSVVSGVSLHKNNTLCSSSGLSAVHGGELRPRFLLCFVNGWLEQYKAPCRGGGATDRAA
jgi:hypothetical protein